MSKKWLSHNFRGLSYKMVQIPLLQSYDEIFVGRISKWYTARRGKRQGIYLLSLCMRSFIKSQWVNYEDIILMTQWNLNTTQSRPFSNTKTASKFTLLVPFMLKLYYINTWSFRGHATSQLNLFFQIYTLLKDNFSKMDQIQF